MDNKLRLFGPASEQLTVTLSPRCYKKAKHIKAHSLFGLLLTILGLKKAANGPLFAPQA